MDVNPSCEGPLSNSDRPAPDRRQMQEMVNHCNKEVLKMSLLIQQEKNKQKDLRYQVTSEDLDVTTRRLRIKQYREKLLDVYMKIFNRYCSSMFPHTMLTDLDELTSDLMKNMSRAVHASRLQQALNYKTLKEQSAREARRERRTLEGLLIALAPPADVYRKLPLPRMLPPKKKDRSCKLQH